MSMDVAVDSPNHAKEEVKKVRSLSINNMKEDIIGEPLALVKLEVVEEQNPD